MNVSQNVSGTQDLRSVVRILWRWKLLLVVFLIALPAVAYWIEHGKPRIYQSSTLIELQTGAGTASGVPTNNGNLMAVAALVNTMPIARLAALYLHEPQADAASLIHTISASPDPTTGFITLTAQATSPVRAALTARAFGRAIGRYQTAQQIKNYDLQIKALNQQLEHIPATPVNATSRASVITQIAQLRADRGATGAGAQVLDPAGVDPTPVGPKTRRAVELAIVIGLLAGLGAVLIAESSDRRLRRPEDLEELTGISLLGSLSTSAFSGRFFTEGTDEAFGMLASSLTYFNVERPLKSLAVASPLAGDGKTTVAVGLALAAAHSGQRVALIDADLRRPRIAERLGIPPQAGLNEVLTHDADVAELLVAVPCGPAAEGSLMVLPAGVYQPNPGALLRSREMRRLMAKLEHSFDLVILDTSPALAVGDALPLFGLTSGVVMIVRMNRSSAAAVRRLVKVINAAKGTLVGIVATGTSSGAGGYGYGSGPYREDTRFTGPVTRVRRRRRRRRQSARAASGRVAAQQTAALESAAETHDDGARQEAGN